MRLLSILSLTATLLTASLPLVAQDSTSTKTATRTGRIVGILDGESGAPLDGAEVIDRIGGGVARTQHSGLIGMAAFASQHDSSVITIRKIGFADTTILVMTGTRDTVPTQIFLRHVATLDTMTVAAHEVERMPFYLRDFEDRFNDVKITGARTFTPSELRKNDGRRLYDVLLMKGIGQQSARCGRIVVIFNGVPYAPPTIAAGSAGVPDDDVDNYDAVVYYTLAQMPMELRRTAMPPSTDATAGRARAFSAAGCGALLLYPRHK